MTGMDRNGGAGGSGDGGQFSFVMAFQLVVDVEARSVYA
jgi:hypothetical protein